MKVNGKCGSVRIRLIPAPRGSGVVGSPTMKKLLERDLRGAPRDLLLPHAGLVEADALRETAFPGMVRLPLAIETISCRILKLSGSRPGALSALLAKQSALVGVSHQNKK